MTCKQLIDELSVALVLCIVISDHPYHRLLNLRALINRRGSGQSQDGDPTFLPSGWDRSALSTVQSNTY